MLIGIDWGTSNVRAFRFGAAGSVVEQRASTDGVAMISGGCFAAALDTLIAGWDDDAEIIMAGMIGSRDGWVETPYLPCPADPAALAGHLVNAPGARRRIVPGLSAPGEVMRGEETQILGAGLANGCVVLPGTHSKWACLADGRVVSFRTAMTGELYRLLLDHSLLGHLAEDGGEDQTAFERGVRRSLAEPSPIATLFSARAEVLLGTLSAGAVRPYLSGLLIGAEIAALARGAKAVTLVGEPALSSRYGIALALAGIETRMVDGATAAAAGLWCIAGEAP